MLHPTQRAADAVFSSYSVPGTQKKYHMDLLMPDLGLLVWNLIAFLILVLILRKFAWKPILNSLKNRETGIADSLALAEKVKAEMAQLKTDNEKLLTQAREERALILKEARDAKDKIIEEAKDKAKAEASKILSDTQAAIEERKMAAIIEVKNLVGKLVIEVSEKILRRELENKDEQEKYISKLANEVKLN
ncbi:MAG: F0F1 ATP synthase subunit B [Chitinophagales bacterium]